MSAQEAQAQAILSQARVSHSPCGGALQQLNANGGAKNGGKRERVRLLGQRGESRLHFAWPCGAKRGHAELAEERRGNRCTERVQTVKNTSWSLDLSVGETDRWR